MAIWLYHINPNSPQEYSYGWDLSRPRTLLRGRARKWPMNSYFRQAKARMEAEVSALIDSRHAIAVG